MSKELIAVEIVKLYLLYLLRYDIKCDENPGENVKRHFLKKISVIFSTFFLLNLSQSNPIQGFYKKKAKKVHNIYL
jgi:hypothetical protein